MSDYMDVAGSSDEVSDEMYSDDINDIYPSEPHSAQETQEFLWYLKYIVGEGTSSSDRFGNEIDGESINPIFQLTPSAMPYDRKRFRVDIQKKLSDVVNEHKNTNSQDSHDNEVPWADDLFEEVKYDLEWAASNSPTTFDALAEEAKKCLVEFGYPEDLADLNIQLLKDYDQIPDSIIANIKNVVGDETKKNKVSVFPLMCGSGKTTALTKWIIETLKRIEWAKRENRKQKGGIEWKKSPFDGMIIVTDSKERLKGIWDAKKKKDNFTEEENEFIRTHEDSVTIMTEENAQIADKEQERKPILLITTQRYFRWEKEEIEEYLHWGPDGQYKRSLIIFDEMPILNEVRDVSVKTLNDIDSALWLGLDDEVDLHDKLWCINQWEHFRNWFVNMLFKFEQDRAISKFYFEPERRNITEDDDRFFKIIIDNKRILSRNKYFQEYQDILTVKKLMSTWGIFSHRNSDTDAYENKITVYCDNRDKVTGIDAKIVVLDGTGKISPIYDMQDYIEIEPEEAFLRPLSYLTIKIGDYPTSRRDFFLTRDTIQKHIKMYLKKTEYDPEKMYYFTYKKQRNKFHKDTEHTAHFGDIKGKNQFRDATVITQVGLNSLQPPQYLAHVLSRYDELRLPLVGRSHKETQTCLERIMKCKEYKDFSSRHLLADVDQCLFRTAIRNVKSSVEVTYFLFYKTAGYKQLTEKIEKRYRDLSASVLIISRDEIDKAWEEGKTAEGRIRAWINSEWKMNPMKRKDVLEELEMNGSTFDSTIRRSKKESGTLWKEICGLKDEAILHGYKKCYYMKKVVQNN